VRALTRIDTQNQIVAKKSDASGDAIAGSGADALPSWPRIPWYSTLRLLPPLIWIPVIAVLLMSLAIAAMSELSARRAHSNNARISQVLLRLGALADIRTLIVDAETGQRGYLLTGEPVFLEPFTQAARGMPDSMARLRELSAASGQVEEALDRASVLMAERLTGLSNIVRAYETSGTEAALALMKSAEDRRVMDSLRAELATLDALTRAELDTLQSERLAAARWSRARLLVMTLVSLGLLVMLTRQFAIAALRQERRRSAAEHEARKLELLVAARTSELSRLSTHLQDYAEKEKSELAHDLHDELGGLLTAAKMDLSWLEGRLSEAAVQQRLTQLGRALDEAMDVKRRVVEDLRPSLLDHFGLATALRAYLDASCRKCTISCELVIDDSLDAAVPKEAAIALFRVAQEAFTNVVRHAAARKIRVELAGDADQFLLSIEDDGCGFDVTSPAVRASHGILGMRHRIGALNGRFFLDSAAGRGTRLRVEIPRDDAQPRAEDIHLERASATSGFSSEMSRILSRK
jgi:signal transduction histidine kinase